MEQIVKVLLQEGIDEETIHEVLDILEDSYVKIPDFLTPEYKKGKEDVKKFDQDVAKIKANKEQQEADKVHNRNQMKLATTRLRRVLRGQKDPGPADVIK